MKKPYDVEVITQVLTTFTPAQRREWFVKMKMSERVKSFDEIATRHRLTRQALSQAVGGSRSWSPRTIRALQADLAVDLTPFLTDKEAGRFRASKSHH